MWCVNRPAFSAEDTFAACISRIQDKDLKRRLAGVAGHIKAEAAVYADRAKEAELHLIAQTVGVAGSVTTDEMVSVYDQRMAGKKGPGRHVYDAIKLLPKQGICPFCDHRPVSTLDHLLPKRLFPALAVTPDNLVGACADCNKTKLAFAPAAAEEVFLHPYFDDIEAERWLAAKVVEGPVAAVIFRTRAIPSWPHTLNERVRRQFRTLGLAQLYGAQAAREISGQAQLLGDIHACRGANGVREELTRQAKTREAVRTNSWQAVTYRTLSESEWFCDGGFRGA
ncbi:HNH endonuclease signature motif containing protein [Bradyrhizobium sp. SZCCHNR1070]|uniref:HNH endonuclease n=1 Tax=Bradyrhizobium sp. SZCCHNR1070 TaxID=3057361 RepID=UPI0029161708|nr:HNH endonuclease signature motif containing protein [Bradyrhizobium sp. SZCCHNR1070]